MSKYDEQLELAPRDIVARAIVDEMEKTRSTFVYIDITHERVEKIKRRFPTIYEYCLQYGLDLTTDWIPVAPAAHYMMGGVKTDLNGETSLKRLFACGEVSSTGVHGANRLASNSLSEAVVFSRRINERIKKLPSLDFSGDLTVDEGRNKTPIQIIVEKRLKLQKIMLRYVGLKRSLDGLEKGYAELLRQLPIYEALLTVREEFEFANLLTCALLTTQSAIARQESRGAHYRVDFPKTDDLTWRKHTIFRREQGAIKESVNDA